MSGPAYPPSPPAGSNAIGSFKIGISSVGDIPSFDPWITVLAQYANSPILDAMILSFNAAADQTADFDNFFDDVFNILTATGYGLDVWGRILGVTRNVQITNPGAETFGFEEAGAGFTGFNQAPFYTGNTSTTNISLTDAQYRPLLLAVAAANVSNGSIPAVNAILLGLFPERGVVFVQDNLNMSVTYVFQFTLTAVELAIVNIIAVLITSAGVSYSIQQV